MEILNISNVSKEYVLKRNHGFNVLSHKQRKKFMALSNINLSIKKGECIGIIGPNGAGKTTLLQVIGRLSIPTKGKVISKGKILSFLDLGAGFQDELTGKENIFFYSSLMGIPKSKTRQKLDEIISFSDLKEFINVKLKKYSTGMKIRLAFATALSHDPDIILLDEILSVGDEIFQKRSMNKIETLKKLGKTIIIVSHVMNNISDICDRVIYLKNGKIKNIGHPNLIIKEYLKDSTVEGYEDIDIINKKLYDLEIYKKKINLKLKSKKVKKSKINTLFSKSIKNSDVEKLKKKIVNLSGEIRNLVIPIDTILTKDILSYERKIDQNPETRKILLHLLDKKIQICNIKLKLEDNESKKSKIVEEKSKFNHKKRSYDPLFFEKEAETKLEEELQKYKFHKSVHGKAPIIENIVLYSSKIDLSNLKNQSLSEEIILTNKITDLGSKFNNFKVEDCKIIYEKLLINSVLSQDINKIKSNSEKLAEFINKNKKNNLDRIKQFVLNELKLMVNFKSHNLILSGYFSIELLNIINSYNYYISKKEFESVNEYILSWIFDAESKITGIKRKLIENSLNNPKSKFKNDINELKKLKQHILILKNEFSSNNSSKKDETRISEVWLTSETGKIVTNFATNDNLTINVNFTLEKSLNNPVIGLIIQNDEGHILISADSKSIKIKSDNEKNESHLKYVIKKIPLLPGKYYITTVIHSLDNPVPHHILEQTHSFSITGNESFNQGTIFVDDDWKK